MATYSVTNTFTADTTAVASEVNQNFTDVLTALNAFDAGNLASGTVPLARISGLTVTQLAAATIVLEAEGIGNNDNDTTWPTSAAVKDFVDTQIDAALPDDDAFGAWLSRSNNTEYQAASDGFVIARSNSDVNGKGFTDGSSPPTTQRGASYATAGFQDSFMMPVKKDDYWKVTNIATVYWLPVGA